MRNKYSFFKDWSCPTFEAELALEDGTFDGDALGITFTYSGAIHEALFSTFREKITELIEDMYQAANSKERIESDD